jgi:hypothetical protein
MKIFAALIGILAGSFAMVFGEFDDSPGLQGLGMILIIFILYRIIKAWRTSANSKD